MTNPLYTWPFSPNYQFCTLLEAVEVRGVGASFDLGATYTSFSIVGTLGGGPRPSELQFRLEGSTDGSTWYDIWDSGAIEPVDDTQYGPYSATGSYRFIRGNLEAFAYETSPDPTFTFWVEANQ
jgi:hypothetical protein